MKGLAVALVVAMVAPPAFADGADGGTVIYDCPDAPRAEQVDGGWFLTNARERRITCEIAACEAHRDALMKPEPEKPSGLVLAIVVGLLAFGAGFAVDRLVK